MKILIINSEYPPIGGGAGNATANIARILVQMGNEVLVLTSGHGNLAATEVCNGVRILRGPTVRRHADRSTALEQVAFIAGASYRSLALIRNFRPDATLAFFGLPSGAIAWLLKRLAGIPYVVSLRGGDVPGFRPYDFWLYHRIAVPWLRIIWHGAAAVVANSGGLYTLAKRFDPKTEITIVPNGVASNDFQTSAREWAPPRLLSVGRVVYQKGYDIAIRALAGLKAFEWEWYIAGDGPHLAALQRMIHQYELGDRVRFLGWLAAEQVKRQYAVANLFVHPSRHEGMPNALLEAMASGLPVIATRISGNEELVVEGKTGLLFPAEDVQAMKAALGELLVQPKLRQSMGLAARERVEKDFGWERVAEQYRSILEEAIS